MSAVSHPHASLSARDRAILEHIGRYHITTNQVVRNVYLPGQQPNAVTKVTARLCRLDHLRSYPLYHPKKYFTLGLRGAALLGLPDNRTFSLGPQSLPTEYGVLSFAVMGRTRHTRLTRGELGSQYPSMPQGLIEQPYCVDDTQQTLELVRVDLGGKPDHVARKCLADIAARVEVNPFAELLTRRRFRLVVVTCTIEKAAAIRAALDSRLWPDCLSIHLVVVSDLLPLIARLSHGS